jgi:hypothetical protein
MRKSEARRDETNGHCLEETMEAQEALSFLTDHILGENWYIESPMRNFQANPIIVNEIIDKYNRATESTFSKVKRLFKEAFR